MSERRWTDIQKMVCKKIDMVGKHGMADYVQLDPQTCRWLSNLMRMMAEKLDAADVVVEGQPHVQD